MNMFSLFSLLFLQGNHKTSRKKIHHLLHTHSDTVHNTICLTLMSGAVIPCTLCYTKTTEWCLNRVNAFGIGGKGLGFTCMLSDLCFGFLSCCSTVGTLCLPCSTESPCGVICCSLLVIYWFLHIIQEYYNNFTAIVLMQGFSGKRASSLPK